MRKIKKDELNEQMKLLEEVSETKLIKGMPVIIRIDGVAFHTFTKGFKKPYDELLSLAMKKTMKSICENIQGCVLGYTQSDEITLVLIDYDTLKTEAWYDYRVQKMASVTASMATNFFNIHFRNLVEYEIDNVHDDNFVYTTKLIKSMDKGSIFDSRVFNIREENILNNLIWRQRDAERNSIQALGQSYFSQKQINGLSINELKEKIKLEKNDSWEEYSFSQKYGTCCIRKEQGWSFENETPRFSEDRDFYQGIIFPNDK